MKKITGIFLMAVLCLHAGFAQKSMTSLSSKEQFGNDVDMFMNVNAWQQVKHEKFFAYGGFGEYGYGDIEIGFAKKFSPLYFGAYLSGGIPTLTFTSSASQKKRTIANPLKGSLIFGFGNIGIKASMYYDPSTYSYIYTPATKMKDWTSNYNLLTSLDFGINLGETQLYAVTTGFSLAATVNKTKQKQNKELLGWTNNSEYTLDIYGGVETDYANNGGVTKTWGVAAKIDTKFTNKKTNYDYPTKKYDTQAGPFKFEFTLTPKWALKYQTEDKKFAIKFTTTADAGISYDVGKNYEYEVVSGTKTYETSIKKTTRFLVTPGLNLGLVFSPKPGTINFNAGVGLTTPTLNISGEKVLTRNGTDGTVTNTTKETKTMFDGNFTGEASIGFTWFITPNVMFDAYWNVLSQFTFDVNTALGTQIAFLLSVKI